MIRRVLQIFTTLLLVFTFALPARAEYENSGKLTGGPRRQIALIIFCGLGGAMLGLSTLSFYGRPQEKLANIGVGFALGIIGGTIFVTYKAAAQPKEFYNNAELFPTDKQLATLAPSAPTLNYSLNF